MHKENGHKENGMSPLKVYAAAGLYLGLGMAGILAAKEYHSRVDDNFPSLGDTVIDARRLHQEACGSNKTDIDFPLPQGYVGIVGDKNHRIIAPIPGVLTFQTNGEGDPKLQTLDQSSSSFMVDGVAYKVSVKPIKIATYTASKNGTLEDGNRVYVSARC